MEPFYEQFKNKYLTPEAKKIVDSDPLIHFHFVYSTWNGEGIFRSFAKNFNEAVRKTKNVSELRKFVIEDRKGQKNSIFAQILKNVQINHFNIYCCTFILLQGRSGCQYKRQRSFKGDHTGKRFTYSSKL